MNSLVQISGLGAICASGLNPEKIFEACEKGQTSVQDQGLAHISSEDFESLKKQTPTFLSESKSSILSFHTMTQALKDSAWTEEQFQHAGFIFATTTGKIDLWEKVITTHKSAQLPKEEYLKGLVNQALGAPHLELAEYFKIKGPLVQISSSCSASLQALAMAFLWIQTGKVDRCIVGSTEINNDLTRVGFNSLRLLSKSPCAPFDKSRTGINLGEASAFLFLEKNLDKTSDSKIPKWGYLSGAGLSSDAFHPTSPHPEGKGSYLAMQKALESADLKASDIDWVYAHGTGSPANDLAESHAIQSLMPHKPYVTSTKSIHGHTLGTCGALESVLGLLAMKKSIILPNTNLKEVDSQIPLNLPVMPIAQKISHFMKSSLGFGGINISVVFSSGVP